MHDSIKAMCSLASACRAYVRVRAHTTYVYVRRNKKESTRAACFWKIRILQRLFVCQNRRRNKKLHLNILNLFPRRSRLQLLCGNSFQQARCCRRVIATRSQERCHHPSSRALHRCASGHLQYICLRTLSGLCWGWQPSGIIA